MAKFLKRHGYSGHRSPAELLERLRAAPTTSSPVPSETFEQLVRVQVRLLRTLLDTIADLDRTIAGSLLDNPMAKLLASLPRVGTINLAQIVAEVGPILDRAVDVEHAAAEAGASPVTRESGKSRGVNFRWAVNTRSRDALAIFADNSRHSEVPLAISLRASISSSLSATMRLSAVFSWASSLRRLASSALRPPYWLRHR